MRHAGPAPSTFTFTWSGAGSGAGAAAAGELAIEGVRLWHAEARSGRFRCIINGMDRRALCIEWTHQLSA